MFSNFFATRWAIRYTSDKYYFTDLVNFNIMNFYLNSKTYEKEVAMKIHSSLKIDILNITKYKNIYFEFSNDF